MYILYENCLAVFQIFTLKLKTFRNTNHVTDCLSSSSLDTLPICKKYWFCTFHHRIQNGSGAYPASYPMRKGGALSLRVKRPGREDDHSSPCSSGVKNAFIFRSTFISLYNEVSLDSIYSQAGGLYIIDSPLLPI
jgi:hypothetical protein